MSTALTTLANVKGYLNITNNGDDTLITRLISAASDLVAQFLNRDLGQQTYTEVYDGSGNRRQVLRYWPITSITSVTLSDVVQAAATSTTSTGYRFDRYSVFFNDIVSPTGVQNVKVVYVGGYATIPSDVEQAAIEIVSYIYRARNRIGEASKVLGQGAGTTSYSLKDIPATARMILQSYMSKSPI